MPEKIPGNIFDLQTEFPDINFATIDPNKAEEEFHFKIASRFAFAWSLKGAFSTPSDQMDVSASAENCLRIIEITVIQVLNAAGYPIAIDAQLDDIRREIHKQLSCYIIKKKQCNLDQTPGKRLDTLLLSYSALNLAERVRISIDKKDIDGIVIYTLNLAEDLTKLIDRYGKHLFGKYEVRASQIKQKPFTIE